MKVLINICMRIMYYFLLRFKFNCFMIMVLFLFLFKFVNSNCCTYDFSWFTMLYIMMYDQKGKGEFFNC